MDPSSFFPIISGMLGGAASAGLFKGPIQTVEDWWYINFGHTTSEKAEMLRAKQNANIDAYKTSLLEETSKIDPANLKEPELKILGPALEASKYYIEDEYLRNMFAKLIAKSMDTSKDSYVQSSFVEIIKQLTPLDAENLMVIQSSAGSELVAQLRINFSTGGYRTQFTHLFLANKNNKDQLLLRTSLDNLQRLGLLSITYDEARVEEPLYNDFTSVKEFDIVKERITLQNNSVKALGEAGSELPTYSGPYIKEGLVRITPYGEAFCATCL